MSNIGSRIKELLIKQDISQKDLARYIGTTEASISRYVNNEREPVAKILYKIAQALNTTTDYLISGRQVKQDDKIKVLKKALYLATEQISELQFGCEEFNMCQLCSNWYTDAENCAEIECEDGFVNYFLNKAREMLKDE